MASNYNHTCIVCGKNYYACNKCEKANSYKVITDKPECFAVHLILTEYRQGVIDKAEAKKKLANKCGITQSVLTKNKSNYITEVYDLLADIVTVASSNKKSK